MSTFNCFFRLYKITSFLQALSNKLYPWITNQLKKNQIRRFEAKGKKICQNANFALEELHKSVDFATVDIELEKRK